MEEEKVFFAGMALVGLVLQGVKPNDAAQMAWQYADHMHEQKPREEKE